MLGPALLASTVLWTVLGLVTTQLLEFENGNTAEVEPGIMLASLRSFTLCFFYNFKMTLRQQYWKIAEMIADGKSHFLSFGRTVRCWC